MATIKDVKGVTAKRDKPVIIPKAYSPERQFMSYEDAVKDNIARKKAREAAEEAYQRSLRESRGEHDSNDPTRGGQAPPLPPNAKIVKLRKALANAEAKLAAKPTSSTWKKKVQKLSEELEAAEAE